MVDEKRCKAVEKGLRLSDGSQDEGFQTSFFFCFLSLSMQLLRSLCCVNLQTEDRRNARARASTPRTGDRGTGKAR